MIAKMYHERSPNKRAVILAKAIHNISSLGADASVRIAMGLYGRQFDKNKPAIVSVVNPEFKEDLEFLCHDAGIIIEFAEE